LSLEHMLKKEKQLSIKLNQKKELTKSQKQSKGNNQKPL
jgi:hypothetical protein